MCHICLVLAELEYVKMVTHTDMEVSRAAYYRLSLLYYIWQLCVQCQAINSSVYLVGVQKAVQPDASG